MHDLRPPMLDDLGMAEALHLGPGDDGGTRVTVTLPRVRVLGAVSLRALRALAPARHPGPSAG